MSHFTVMVIGPDYEAQLAPYHEYECTGIDDEYVIDVDVTDKIMSDYAKYGKGEPLAEFAEGWSNAFEKDGRYYQHTNPNAKWDWYVLGGRWTGSLKLKEKTFGIVGQRGLMTDQAPAGYADQAMKNDVDFAQMRNDAEVKARALWNMTHGITGGIAWESWDDTRIRYPAINNARREYHEQPAIVLLKASKNKAYDRSIDDDLALDLDIYIQRQRDAACVNYAFVRNGQWSERGKMGWFGCASDEINKSQWNRMFNDMIDSLPDDTLISIVDCHI